MSAVEKLYWRSGAGVRAGRADPGLPSHFRRILEAMPAPTTAARLRAALAAASLRELVGLLEQLETLGFVSTAPGALEYRLRTA